MLTSLTIKNFALIDDLSMHLGGGFTIITGETGSGKSIILEALGLILGKRADLTALGNAEDKCVIEAEFALGQYPAVQAFFKEEGLDYEEKSIIRREILPSGKSRAFLNDSPTTLDVLTRLGKILVDIHSQHDTLALGEETFQIELIDALAGNQALLDTYLEQYNHYKNEQKKLQKIENTQLTAKKEYDYNQFILQELQNARLEKGMQEDLEQRYEQGANVEDIQERLGFAGQILQGDESGILSLLIDLKASFGKLTDYGEQYSELFQRIDNAYIELDDIAQEIESLSENIEFNPKELAKIHQKLQRIYDLQKKHQVQSVEELLKIQEKLSQELGEVENIDDAIAQQKALTEQALEQLSQTASTISEKRSACLPSLCHTLETILADLGMPNAHFNIDISPREEYGPTGKDSISLLFSANKGGNMGLLRKTASGGELSRIMLAVKMMLSERTTLPTMIFDEIDTGVSGEIAHKMGELMKQMSKSGQVFAISHLPQVASKGQTHLKVYKTEAQGKTITQIKKLTPEERLEEIAQMLGGKEIRQSAIEHAKELLNN